MVKNKKLIKCIQSAMCHDLVRGTYNYKTVRVYFGFDNYRADIDQIVELSAAIMQESHGITLDKMGVCTISPFQSDRHMTQTRKPPYLFMGMNCQSFLINTRSFKDFVCFSACLIKFALHFW